MSKKTNTPKGYKDSVLGIIPEDWEIIQFGKVSNIVRGGSPRPAGDPRYFNGNYIPWLTVASLTNIPDSQITVTQTEGYLTKEGATQSRLLKTGTLILSNSGATLGVAKILNIDCCANDGIAAFNNLNEKIINKNYAYYFLNSKTKYFREVIAPGNGQPNLNTELIGVEKIPVPPLLEQKSIASCLSTWDKAIQLTTQLIAQKELRKKYLIQQLLSGKKRLKGFAKEKWNLISINEIAKEVSIKNKDNKDLIVLSCTKYDGLVPSLEYFGRKIFSDDLTSYKIVPKNHFAYATNHIEEGSIGYQSTLESSLISPMYTVFKTNGQIIDNYLYRVLKSYIYIHEYKKRMEGSIDRRGGLRWDTFAKIKVPVLSIPEQNAISNIFSSLDYEINTYQTKLNQLKEQKKGLMQVLLTGKKRLKLKK